ncbi:hypothetical protein JCM3770_004908 [Rhodotorula araucariae]
MAAHALPLASRRTSPTRSAASSDALAFLAVKPYLTTIRMPSFALSPLDEPAAAGPSSSAASPSAFPLKGPWAPSRRDSFASVYSSAGSSTECDDSSDEDEAVTPPVSPDLIPADGGNDGAKGEGVADAFHLSALSFSLAEIAEDDDAATWHHPTAASPPATVPAPIAPSSAPIPAAPVAPRTAFQPLPPDPREHAVVRPPPQPSPPATATSEDEPRGRSRWPRLLWRSELDRESLVVLRDYHERAIGAPLPILKRGMRPQSVARWSRRIEDAGL